MLKSFIKQIISFTAIIILFVVFGYGQELPVLPYKTKPAPVKKTAIPKPSQTSADHKVKEADNALAGMVLVQGGTFSMGSNEGSDDEKPVHTVTVSSFYISKNELTVAEFKKFIDATGYTTPAETEGWSYIYSESKREKRNGVNWRCGTDGSKLMDFEMNKPVIYVCYNDAVKYCQWKSYVTGKNFRLPTEAEWEYAARGGNKSNGYKFSGSDNIDAISWYKDNSGSTTHPVGQKGANELGLYDMSGNVWEWCSDWYGYDYYSQSPSDNPKGPINGTSRVIRGGSWYYDAQDCRISYRDYYSPDYRVNIIGFRVVCSL